MYITLRQLRCHNYIHLVIQIYHHIMKSKGQDPIYNHNTYLDCSLTARSHNLYIQGATIKCHLYSLSDKLCTPSKKMLKITIIMQSNNTIIITKCLEVTWELENVNRNLNKIMPSI